jgi:hypothetical protein
LSGFFQTIHGLIDPEVDEPLSLRVEPDEGSERKTQQDLGMVSVDLDFYKLFSG